MALVHPDVDTSLSQAKVINAQTTTDPLAKGLALIFTREQVLDQFKEDPSIQFRVKLRCDFVVDDENPDKARAIDGEFPRAELLSGDRPHGGDHGLQGGTFVSWFKTNDLSEDNPMFNPAHPQWKDSFNPGGDVTPIRVTFRTDMPRSELTALAGVRDARARKILNFLQDNPIRNWNDLQDALGMSDTEFKTFQKNNEYRIRFN